LGTWAGGPRALALRGLVALLFGLVVLFWPNLVFAVLALVFGIYAEVDGTIAVGLALAFSGRGAQRSLPLAEGAVGIVAGLVTLLWPGMTANGLVYVIAGWVVVTGGLKMLTAILLRADVENGWLLAGSGALSVLFDIVLGVLARSDVPFLAPFIGGFAVVVGLALIVFAFPFAGTETMTCRGRCLPASPGGFPLGDTRLWGMTHHRGGTYARRASCASGANEKLDRRDVAMDRRR